MVAQQRRQAGGEPGNLGWRCLVEAVPKAIVYDPARACSRRGVARWQFRLQPENAHDHATENSRPVRQPAAGVL